MSEQRGPDSFWKELRERRVVRVAALYGAVGWAVVQGAQTLQELLPVPDWTAQLVLVLLILGFPVALVLAWAFQLTKGGVTRTEASKSTAGHPSRLPFVAGLAVGIASVSAVAFVLSGDDAGPDRMPDVALSSDVVAVVPFRYSGPPDLAYFGEGVVDLLAARLSGEVGPRAVDPATIGAHWTELSEIDPANAGQRTAERLGAGLLLIGSIVADPAGLNVTATLKDVARGEDIASTEEQGPPSEIGLVLDRVAVALLSLSAGEAEESLDEITSTSTEAVEAYLLGQQAWREGRFDTSVRHFLRALEHDSTFALAAMGAADASTNSVLSSGGALQLAWRHRDRLSERDRIYLRARLGPRYPDPTTGEERVRAFLDAAAAIPDRAQVWYFLGDEYFHYRAGLADDWSELSESYFRRAVELDPRHGAALSHLDQVYTQRGDREATRANLAVYGSLNHPDSAVAIWARAKSAVLADDTTGWGAAVADALGSSDYRSPAWVAGLINSITSTPDTFVVRTAVELTERSLELPTTGNEDNARHQWAYRMYQLMGRPQQANAVLARYEAANGPIFASDRIRMLDGAFGTLEPAVAEAAAARIEESLRGRDPSELDPSSVLNLIALNLYRFERGSLDALPASIETLRVGGTGQPPARREAWETAALLFESLMHERLGDLDLAAEALQRMDESYVKGPAFGNRMGQQGMLFTVAGLYERLGDPEKALAVLDREWINFNIGDIYQARFARERGRLAALVGDTERAIREYRYYLTVRFDHEPGVAAEVEEVRRAYEALIG